MEYKMQENIMIKSKQEIEIMRQGGAILSAVLKKIMECATIGTSTLDLDSLAEKLIREAGAEPAFKNYRPVGATKAFPFTICASLNEVIVHGLPSDYKLRSGDLLKLDLGLKYNDYYLDTAATIIITKHGTWNMEHEIKEKLIKITREALYKGIDAAKTGNTLGDIGHAIQAHVEKNSFTIIRDLIGHGIGKNLHELPNVFNYGAPNSGEKLREGMVIAIEPMVSAGKNPNIKQLKNDSFATADDALSAHFEHTVAILKNGAEILTI